MREHVPTLTELWELDKKLVTVIERNSKGIITVARPTEAGQTHIFDIMKRNAAAARKATPERTYTNDTREATLARINASHDAHTRARQSND